MKPMKAMRVPHAPFMDRIPPSKGEAALGLRGMSLLQPGRHFPTRTPTSAFGGIFRRVFHAAFGRATWEENDYPPFEVFEGGRGMSLNELDGTFQRDTPRRLKPAAPLQGGIFKRAWESRCFVFLVGFVLLASASSALAGYKSLKVKVDAAKTYPYRQTQGAVTIAADPYESNDKIRTAFDLKDMEKLGVVPVNLIISNEGEDVILITGSDINLLDPKNRSIESTPPEEVVQLILNKGKGGPSLGRTPSPFPLPRREGIKGDAFEIETDFNNKSLKELRVAPKTTAYGFVFFRLPNQQMKLAGYKVYIPEIKNLKTKTNLLFFEIEIK